MKHVSSYKAKNKGRTYTQSKRYLCLWGRRFTSSLEAGEPAQLVHPGVKQLIDLVRNTFFFG